jgi:hypothetical protein
MKHRLPKAKSPPLERSSSAPHLEQTELIVDDVQRQDEPESMNGPGTPPSGEIQPPAVPPMLPPLDEPAAPQSEENSFKVPEPEHPPAEPGFAPQPSMIPRSRP